MRARRRCSCEQAQASASAIASASASVYTRVLFLSAPCSLARSLARLFVRPLALSHANTCVRTRELWKSDPRPPKESPWETEREGSRTERETEQENPKKKRKKNQGERERGPEWAEDREPG